MKPVKDVSGVSAEVATYLSVEPFVGALTEVQQDELGERVHEAVVKGADSLASFPDLAEWDDVLLDSVAKAMRQVVFKGGDVGRVTRAQGILERIPCLRRAFQKRESARRRREQKVGPCTCCLRTHQQRLYRVVRTYCRTRSFYWCSVV